MVGYLGRHSPAATAAMMASDVGDTLERLVASRSHRSQVSGLRELAALAMSSDAVAAQLLTPPLLAGLLVHPFPLKPLMCGIAEPRHVLEDTAAMQPDHGLWPELSCTLPSCQTIHCS